MSGMPPFDGRGEAVWVGVAPASGWGGNIRCTSSGDVVSVVVHQASKASSWASGETMFTLPVGCRPTNAFYVMGVLSSNAGPKAFLVNTNGTVQVVLASATADGIYGQFTFIR